MRGDLISHRSIFTVRKPDRFQIIDGKLMPALNTIDGMGDNAADRCGGSGKRWKILIQRRFQTENKGN